MAWCHAWQALGSAGKRWKANTSQMQTCFCTRAHNSNNHYSTVYSAFYEAFLPVFAAKSKKHLRYLLIIIDKYCNLRAAHARSFALCFTMPSISILASHSSFPVQTMRNSRITLKRVKLIYFKMKHTAVASRFKYALVTAATELSRNINRINIRFGFLWGFGSAVILKPRLLKYLEHLWPIFL